MCVCGCVCVWVGGCGWMGGCARARVFERETEKERMGGGEGKRKSNKRSCLQAK